MFLNEKTQLHGNVSYPKLVYIFNVKSNPNLALQVDKLMVKFI